MGLYVGNTKYKLMVGGARATFIVEPMPYDYQVEWLGTNGNVVFNTGYVPNTYDLYINGKMYYVGYTDTSSWLSWFAAYTNEQASTYRIIRNSTSNTQVLLYNGRVAGGGGVSAPVTQNAIHTFEFTPTTLKINNNSYSFTKSGNANTGNLTIFSAKFKGRVYYFQLKKGDEFKLDLIPVVKDGVGCLYNKVNGDIFYNTSTGTITLGPMI